MPKLLRDPVPRFNLTHCKKEFSSIVLVFRWRYLDRPRRLVYSPGLGIWTKDWDSAHQYPRRSPRTARLIRQLGELERHTLAIYAEAGPGQLSPEHLREELDHRFKKIPREPEKVTPSLAAFAAAYARTQQARPDLSRGTWKVLITWANHLAAFEQYRGAEIPLAAVDMDLRAELIGWAYEVKGLSTNYVAKGLEVLRQFMGAAADKGLIDANPADRKGWRLKKTPTATISLTEEELDALFTLDLSADPPAWQKARQLFIIGAYTGLRLSDLQRIRPGHISTGEGGEKVFRIVAQKTRKPVTIALHPHLEAVLEEVGYRAPKISPPAYNRAIKLVAAKAGIKELRPVYTASGGEVEEKFLPKCELITAHCSRRTFATLALIKGWPTTLVRTITGHSTERQLLNYIDYSAYLSARQVAHFYQKEAKPLRACR